MEMASSPDSLPVTSDPSRPETSTDLSVDVSTTNKDGPDSLQPAPIDQTSSTQIRLAKIKAAVVEKLATAKVLAVTLINKVRGGPNSPSGPTTTFTVGMAVEARFNGKDNFFPGKIVQDNNDGTYAIDYEDGEQEFFVEASLIRDPNAPVQVLVVSSDDADGTGDTDGAAAEAAAKKASAAASAQLLAKKREEVDVAQKQASQAAAAAAAATDPEDKERLEKAAALAVEKAGNLAFELSQMGDDASVEDRKAGEEKEEEQAKGRLRFVRWCRQVLTPTAAQKRDLERMSNKLPSPPRNVNHALLLADNYLNIWVPHWFRYWLFSGCWHIFPFWYGTTKSGSIPGQCSEDLLLWMEVCGNLSAGRLFGVCTLSAIRIRNRLWEGQNFGEAMAEIFHEITDGADDLDPYFMQGERLIFILVSFHLCEFVWMIWGWAYYANIQVCDNSVQYASLWLLLYQMFNLVFFAFATDFVWPWCYLERQTDVDVITKKKKPPPPRKVENMQDDDDVPPPLPPLDLGNPEEASPGGEGKEGGGGGDAGASESGNMAKLLRKGELKSTVQARAAANEMNAAWENIGASPAKAAATKDKGAAATAAGATAGKGAPGKGASAQNKRKAKPKGRKVGPQGNVTTDESGKPLVGGSAGDEWWRQQGRAPPRKAIGGVFATAQNRRDQEKESKRKKVVAALERPKTSGGRTGGGGGWFGVKSKVTPQETRKAKSNSRPKTAPARS